MSTKFYYTIAFFSFFFAFMSYIFAVHDTNNTGFAWFLIISSIGIISLVRIVTRKIPSYRGYELLRNRFLNKTLTPALILSIAIVVSLISYYSEYFSNIVEYFFGSANIDLKIQATKAFGYITAGFMFLFWLEKISLNVKALDPTKHIDQ